METKREIKYRAADIDEGMPRAGPGIRGAWRALLPPLVLFFGFALPPAPACAYAGTASDVTALEVLRLDTAEDGALIQHSAFNADGALTRIVRLPAKAPAAADSPRRDDDPFAARAPLGSLWKLFVFLWLSGERHPAPDYVCRGAQRKEEAYCCDPGHAIARDAALLRSCGLFFSPDRLGIDPAAWRAFWQARPGVREAAPWLADLGAMKAETVVSPASILHALAAAPAPARGEASALLLARVFSGAERDRPIELARRMGGRLRIKTFSWHLPGTPDALYGGGAGWLSDGRPVWFAGAGTGQQVMARHGAVLAEALAAAPAPKRGVSPPGCVRVNFFARYPFTLERPDGEPAPAGALRGRYLARFQNGVSLPFTANGELSLSRAREDGRPRIEGRFSLDGYGARVLEREADPRESEAARALSVVIRSYLMNEARRQGNCLVINDSSRAQRVSINPPGAAARAIAGFTSGLVLRGTPVGYHSVTASANRMAWTQAVAASRAGQPWDVILRNAFPAADLGALNDPAGVPCRRFALAENWLAARAPRWHRILQEHLPGFEPPPAPRVCLLAHGAPFSEQDRNRIHVRALKTNEERLTLIHEYLHLGLRRHPAGHDEDLVERWARRLLDGENIGGRI
ncbi:MAG: DUF2300 domain-containing protein [Azoarcus sp.]|jgi:uncharacterized protein YfaQ (DUF2300 family)|nr:DUF2300 domain-containing protein [Azoarcus sp.]